MLQSFDIGFASLESSHSHMIWKYWASNMNIGSETARVDSLAKHYQSLLPIEGTIRAQPCCRPTTQFHSEDKMKKVSIGLAAIVCLFMAAPASAMPMTHASSSSDIVLVRGGGHGFHGFRGHHRGWFVGRHRGWRPVRRHWR
jgi:hypothetical protein